MHCMRGFQLPSWTRGQLWRGKVFDFNEPRLRLSAGVGSFQLLSNLDSLLISGKPQWNHGFHMFSSHAGDSSNCPVSQGHQCHQSVINHLAGHRWSSRSHPFGSQGHHLARHLWHDPLSGPELHHDVLAAGPDGFPLKRADGPPCRMIQGWWWWWLSMVIIYIMVINGY